MHSLRNGMGFALHGGMLVGGDESTCAVAAPSSLMVSTMLMSPAQKKYISTKSTSAVFERITNHTYSNGSNAGQNDLLQSVSRQVVHGQQRPVGLQELKQKRQEQTKQRNRKRACENSAFQSCNADTGMNEHAGTGMARFLVFCHACTNNDSSEAQRFAVHLAFYSNAEAEGEGRFGSTSICIYITAHGVSDTHGPL